MKPSYTLPSGQGVGRPGFPGLLHTTEVRGFPQGFTLPDTARTVSVQCFKQVGALRWLFAVYGNLNGASGKSFVMLRAAKHLGRDPSLRSG